MNDSVKGRPSIEKRVTFENYSTVVTAASTMDTYSTKHSSEDSDSEGSFSGYESYTVGMVERGLGACGIDQVNSIETLNSSDSEEEGGGCAGIMTALERKSTIRREYACGEHEHSDKLWNDRRKNDDLRYLSKFAAKINADKQLSGGPSPILSLNSCTTEENNLSSSEDARDDDPRGDNARDDDAREDSRLVDPEEEEDTRDTISVISEGLSKMFAETTLFNIQEKDNQDGAEKRDENESVSKVSHKSVNESSYSNKRDQPENASIVTSSTGKSTRNSSSSSHQRDQRDNVSIVTASTATTKKTGKKGRESSSSSRHRNQSDNVSVATSATTSTKKSRKMKEKKILKNQEEHGGRKSGLLGWRKKKDKSYNQNDWRTQDSDRIEL